MRGKWAAAYSSLGTRVMPASLERAGCRYRILTLIPARYSIGGAAAVGGDAANETIRRDALDADQTARERARQRGDRLARPPKTLTGSRVVPAT